MKPNAKQLLGLIATFSLVSALSGAESLPIALLNPDRVFKAHRPFQEKLTQLQEEAKEIEQAVQARQAELETVANQARKAVQGSAEWTRLQTQLIKLQGEFQQYVGSERQALQRKEGLLLLGFHKQLDAVVSKYAQAHGIKLVIRQSEGALDENQPLAEIAKAINRGILYEEGLDITEEILKALEVKPAAGGAER